MGVYFHKSEHMKNTTDMVRQKINLSQHQNHITGTVHGIKNIRVKGALSHLQHMHPITFRINHDASKSGSIDWIHRHLPNIQDENIVVNAFS